MALLEVADLTVSFPTSDGVVRAVRGASFSVDSGQTLGIVGESGSGKSVSMLTLLGLVPGAHVSGRVTFEGLSLLDLSPAGLRQVSGERIGWVTEPLSSQQRTRSVQIVERP